MITLLVIILILFLLFGGYGTRAGWGVYGWSPLALIIVIILVLYLTGNLSL
jgi:hypothetical protein